MGIILSTADSGEPSATVAGTRLHSAYHPSKEAARFLEAQKTASPKNGTVIIIGAGLGYLDRVLRQKNFCSQVFSFHLHQDSYKARLVEGKEFEGKSPLHTWHPGSLEDAETFLLSRLDETSLSGLRVYQWPAAYKAWPETAQQVSSAVAAVVRRLTGNVSAAATFGRSWINNTLRNYLSINRIMRPSSLPGAIVLAASGPSLETLLPVLSATRERYTLWALPSSLAALEKAKLEPDLIFSTDPGYWARLHGRYYSEAVPVAMPLLASPPPVQSGPPLLIAQNELGEFDLLKNPDWPFLSLPSRGTVAATALDTWRQVGSGTLFIAGLDLCWQDLRAHVRPHSFDAWLDAASDRKNPKLTIAWERSRQQSAKRWGAQRLTPALQTYADWFQKNPLEGSVKRLLAPGSMRSAISLPHIEEVEISVLQSLVPFERKKKILESIPSPLNQKERYKKVRQLIHKWEGLLKQSKEKEDFFRNKEREQLLYALDTGAVLKAKRTQKRTTEAMEEQRERAGKILHNLARVYG